MFQQIPLYLVTGFLGSGKTSFISNVLAIYAQKHKIAIVQNEFAQSSVDSEILKDEDYAFMLRELNRGSIFCACQFSNFKETLIDLSTYDGLDMVIIEATGIADPMAVAQLMMDNRLRRRFYLSKIVTLVDMPRFMKLKRITAVKHQIEVADYILLNKSDLVDESVRQEVEAAVALLNPMAVTLCGNHGQFQQEKWWETLGGKLVSDGIEGELTQCKQGNYTSNVYCTSKPISILKVSTFLQSLDSDVLRVKGYVTDEAQHSYLVQYVPGQLEILPWNDIVGRTELISIGFKDLDFSILE